MCTLETGRRASVRVTGSGSTFRSLREKTKTSPLKTPPKRRDRRSSSPNKRSCKKEPSLTSTKASGPRTSPTASEPRNGSTGTPTLATGNKGTLTASELILGELATDMKETTTKESETEKELIFMPMDQPMLARGSITSNMDLGRESI
jgi:hypothetical protein